MGRRRGGRRKCVFLFNTDVSATLYLADLRRVAHPLREWVREQAGRGRCCYSPVLERELRRMVRRGKIGEEDRVGILRTLGAYGVWRAPARSTTEIKREARRLRVVYGLRKGLATDIMFALHAVELGAYMTTYNVRDYIEIGQG